MLLQFVFCVCVCVCVCVWSWRPVLCRLYHGETTWAKKCTFNINKIPSTSNQSFSNVRNRRVHTIKLPKIPRKTTGRTAWIQHRSMKSDMTHTKLCKLSKWIAINAGSQLRFRFFFPECASTKQKWSNHQETGSLFMTLCLKGIGVGLRRMNRQCRFLCPRFRTVWGGGGVVENEIVEENCDKCTTHDNYISVISHLTRKTKYTWSTVSENVYTWPCQGTC